MRHLAVLCVTGLLAVTVSGCDVVPATGGVAYPGYATAQPDYLVRSTQKGLIRLGYLHDFADGVLGPRTQGAIMGFQRANGMAVDGQPSWGLLSRIEMPTAIAAPPVIVAPVVMATPVAVTPPATPAPAPANTQWVQPAPSAPPAAVSTANTAPPPTTSSGWVQPAKAP